MIQILYLGAFHSLGPLSWVLCQVYTRNLGQIWSMKLCRELSGSLGLENARTWLVSGWFCFWKVRMLTGSSSWVILAVWSDAHVMHTTWEILIAKAFRLNTPHGNLHKKLCFTSLSWNPYFQPKYPRKINVVAYPVTSLEGFLGWNWLQELHRMFGLGACLGLSTVTLPGHHFNLGAVAWEYLTLSP